MITSQYGTAIRDIVAETESEKVLVVDLWKAMMVEFGPKSGRK